ERSLMKTNRLAGIYLISLRNSSLLSALFCLLGASTPLGGQALPKPGSLSKSAEAARPLHEEAKGKSGLSQAGEVARLLHVSEVRFWGGDVEGAQQFADQALALARKTSDRHAEAEAL